MNGLILDTSNNRSFVILCTKNEPIAYLPLPGGEELSKCLGQKINTLLKEHPSFRVQFIAIGTGPGSFTGIRVGVAMAKALAYAWKIPFVSFCSLKAFLPSKDGPFAILFDARMGGYYCLEGNRSSDDVQFEEPRVIRSLEHFAASTQLISPHPEEIYKRKNIDQTILDVPPNPQFLSCICYQAALSNPQNPLDFLPLSYLNAFPSLA